MTNIDVRDLKAQASKIVWNVRRKRAWYVVTYRGKPVGLLSPLETLSSAGPTNAEAAWAELTRLGQTLSQNWTAAQNSIATLSAIRR